MSILDGFKFGLGFILASSLVSGVLALGSFIFAALFVHGGGSI